MARRSMRVEVADSWNLSAASGVSVDKAEAPITVAEDTLHDWRSSHSLAQVKPLWDDVLGDAAVDCEAIMAVSDANGQLLWVSGSSAALRHAESIGFVEGSNWDERMSGTNAVGLALRLGRPAEVRRDEHFRHSVQRWSCSASPIYDPNSGELLGVLDITGAGDIAVPQTLAMVKTAVRMAEAELARGHIARTAPAAAASVGSLQVVIETLGRTESMVQIDDTRGRRHELKLSPRHSEIMLLLASAGHGLTGDELAVLLYEGDGGTSTLRAEMNRLRSLLGDDILRSRPYRLGGSITVDWLAVEAQLASGDVRGALHAYRGPLLPRSLAPGVVALRDQLHFSLREAVRASGEADLMVIWTRSSWGRDDYDMWVAQRDVVADRAPLRSLIDGQLARLDAELA